MPFPGPPRFNAGRPGFGDRFSTLVIVWVPHPPFLGVSCFWRLFIFAKWPGRTPFSGAEKPLIAFICELKKQVRRGLVLLGEGQFAISDRSGVAHGISNPTQQKDDSSTGKRFGSGQRWRAVPGGPIRFQRSARNSGACQTGLTSGLPRVTARVSASRVCDRGNEPAGLNHPLIGPAP